MQLYASTISHENVSLWFIAAFKYLTIVGSGVYCETDVFTRKNQNTNVGNSSPHMYEMFKIFVVESWNKSRALYDHFRIQYFI